jgi:lysophospholipase L1-like esterase
MRFKAGRSLLLALVSMLVHAGGATAEPQIVWQVENPFRFFLDAADTQVHRATWQSLSEVERRHPVQSEERALGDRHPDGWSTFTYTKTCWDWTRNRYACRERPDYLSPKSHAVMARLEGLEDAQTVDCSWLTSPQGQERGPRSAVVTLPCDTPVQLDMPFPSGAWISVEIGGRQVAEAAARVTDLFIVGMGDSYASGEGNPDVPVRFSPERTTNYGFGANKTPLTGYPARIGDWKTIGDRKFIDENARWQDQACHRSLYSHQLRAALQIAIEDPHRAVTFVGFACSGAETTFGLFLDYKGNEWVPYPPDLPQISAVAEAQCGGKGARNYDLPEAYHISGKIPELQGGLVLKKCDAKEARKIDLLLLSIGGNDVGFSRLVANAVLADSSILRKLGGWFGQVHGFAEANAQLDALDDRLKSVNRALHNLLHVPWSESDRVILTAYPPMAVLADGKSVCPDGQAGMTVLSEFSLSEAKAREGSAAAERLNAIMKESAHQYLWTFAESHRATFRGRGLCAGYSDAPWTMADELRVPRKINGVWDPYNPSQWRAYAPRERLFRTPNDAYLTGNFHVEETLMQKVLSKQGYGWLQLLLASVYSGAFHPSAEGQAAIADAVVEKARGVLAKYENRATQPLKRIDLGLVDDPEDRTTAPAKDDP